MPEKKFKFTRLSVGKTGDSLYEDGWREEYSKSESELTEHEKQLLLGSLIKYWDDLPASVQIMFLQQMTDAINLKYEWQINSKLLQEN